MRYWQYGHNSCEKNRSQGDGHRLYSQMLTQAKMEADLDGTKGIEWRLGDVEDLPFEDDSFDAVLSSFGHMFSPHPEVAIKEMLRVTKSGGRIAFATWPPEHANGKFFDVMAKYVSIYSASHANTASPNALPTPYSPMQWGTPEVIQKHLGVGRNVKNIHFEGGVQ